MAETRFDIKSGIRLFSQLSEPMGALIKEYASGHAPQALMLSGPSGVGKRTLSSFLSMALLCGSDSKPCGHCKGCRRAENFTHPNLLKVKTGANEKSVKVEQARTLLSMLASYPMEIGPRVVMLEMVDLFTPQAQNALLKALEEPDPGTFFILTTSQEKAVLPTVRSRCHLVRIPLWPDALLEDFLISQNLNAAEAKDLCAISGGSPGHALQIHRDPRFLAIKKLAESAVLSVRGLSDIPAASAMLKDARDEADSLLDYLEDAAVRQTKKFVKDDGNLPRARRLLEAVLEARKRRMSNVSWQAVSDNLLLSILEDPR